MRYLIPFKVLILYKCIIDTVYLTIFFVWKQPCFLFLSIISPKSISCKSSFEHMCLWLGKRNYISCYIAIYKCCLKDDFNGKHFNILYIFLLVLYFLLLIKNLSSSKDFISTTLQMDFRKSTEKSHLFYNVTKPVL